MAGFYDFLTDPAIPLEHLILPTRLPTFALVASKDKTYYRSHGANHYYAGQPELLQQVVAMELDWLRERNLIDF